MTDTTYTYKFALRLTPRFREQHGRGASLIDGIREYTRRAYGLHPEDDIRVRLPDATKRAGAKAIVTIGLHPTDDEPYPYRHGTKHVLKIDGPLVPRR